MDVHVFPSFFEQIAECWDQLPEEHKAFLRNSAATAAETVEEFFKELNKYWEKIPSEVRSLIPSAIDFTVKVRSAYHSAQRLNIVNAEIRELLEPRVFGPMPEHYTKLRDLVEQREQLVNQCLKWTTIISSLIVAAEAISLYFAYQNVKNANNILEKHKEALPRIGKLVESLKCDTEKLAGYLAEAETKEPSKKLIKKIERLANQVSFQSSDALNEIGRIQVSIEGQIKTIGDIKRDQLIQGFSNAIHGLGSSIQIMQMANHISNPWVFFTTAVAGSFFALAAGNVVVHKMSSETLKELQVTLVMVQDLDNQVKYIRAIVEKALKLVAEDSDDSE